VIALLVALHLIAGTAVLVGGRRARLWVFAVATAPMLATVVVVATRIPRVLDHATPTDRWTWIDALGIEITFRLDGYALLMALAVGAVGTLVMVYSLGYFAGHPDTARTCRFAGFMTMFAGAMLGLVTAGDVWSLFTFWELTTVTSFLLIGLDDGNYTTRLAANRALLVTAAGGLVMLGGLVCLVEASGSSDLDELLAGAGDGPLAQVGVALLLVGAFTKSAQIPFHFWLPGAMAAPTPVSAYLHSATMVKAGVVLVARLAPAFAVLDWWRPALVAVGGATMLLGGVAALRRDDAKQALAFGTVSQLGFLILLAGFGDPAVTAAGVAMLAAHVVFKCGLFLVVGAVDQATGTRSLTTNSGVGRALPVLAVAAGLCTLSMLGFPLLFGFVAKESAFAALHEARGAWATIALVVAVVGSMLTVAYSVRLWWGLFGTKREHAGVGYEHVDSTPGPLLTVPVYLFAAASLAGGVLAGPLAGRLAVATEALDEAAHAHLEVWPGFHVPLLLSALAILGGLVIGVPVIARPDRPAFSGQTVGERVFGRAYDDLLNGARGITLVTQSGSLPVYVAVVFATVAAAIGFGLAFGSGIDWGDIELANSVLQGLVGVLAALMGIAVVLARRRFVSVLLLGGVGQGLTVLFLLWGAPDLALTQFLIESLSIVAFLLVLRHLPPEYRPAPSWAPGYLRVAIAVLVGVAFAGVALAAGTVDRPTDVTDAVNELAYPEGGGHNVVNVTLVDFRGIDTMFEITVFAVAALGVANLVAAASGGRARRRRTARVGARSMVFEQTTKMIFHLTLLVSLYVMLRGHSAPGGGFAGGLIAGAAFVFRLLSGADDRPQSRRTPTPLVLIALGLLLATGTGIGGLVGGGEFLESDVWDFHLPGLGDQHFPTAGIFDAGVYFLVIGVVILMLGSLAARVPAPGDEP
jgi:multicomponent Na+:H+ antiporter subunit A